MKLKVKPIRAWADYRPICGKLSIISGDASFYAIYTSKREAEKDMKNQHEFSGGIIGNLVEVEIRPLSPKRKKKHENK